MDEIINKLIDNGWRSVKYPNSPKTLYWKTFPGHQICKANPDKGKQIEIYYYDRSYVRFEVECVGQLNDETWINITCYAIDNPTYEKLMDKVNELLNTWDIIANNNIKK